ncbi:MAG: four helix bundle protein [Candidatus Parcubacteria bacterium]|nr:four helix bundle protein [Candidatus Parcubacteria bacterium]
MEKEKSKKQKGTDDGKITSFTQLEVWKTGHKTVLDVYLITKKFPKEEIFGITSQMRRCAVSITSNIAEGFGRFSYKEKVQFYAIARGSITELQNQLLISKDIGYLSKSEFERIAKKTVDTHKMLQGLIKSSQKRIQGVES